MLRRVKEICDGNMAGVVRVANGRRAFITYSLDFFSMMLYCTVIYITMIDVFSHDLANTEVEPSLKQQYLTLLVISGLFITII